MKEFLETTLGKGLLIIIVLGVWGVNFINFSEILSPSNEIVNRDIREVSLEDLVMPTSSTYKYKETSRDPFNPNRRVVETPIKKEVSKQEEKPFQLPQLSLNGIIGETAIITDSGGESYFVAKGDSLLSSYIIQVTRDSVILSSQNRRFILTLNSTDQ
ncbi:hypothetical protein A8B79_05870 [Balneola sp. EhC07]|uniref:hypothetical protein n=1 Tax=Balneola sp. EhC07 TaxID=1849360 RepID=UPI0007F47813|nr:hypothetical protein [Balneola sp. EhC07]OAN61002.1 hypothetical protein A8B79_05870 [Balneola sp. EhC07]